MVEGDIKGDTGVGEYQGSGGGGILPFMQKRLSSHRVFSLPHWNNRRIIFSLLKNSHEAKN
jgi:hypothetical protein